MIINEIIVNINPIKNMIISSLQIGFADNEFTNSEWLQINNVLENGKINN